ncbi:hypothetical protein E2562_027240 [Oryza meyeriana var. granulata]|uniref:Uncharacterized protein n=1 Tax=Oryza meyeriana var. granulata TaxID=110450 RepID=A0A6G1D7E1_9ORYZ|nr:hypothetical protein E2562_027240 [Oryza meyeriana var. granulata]
MRGLARRWPFNGADGPVLHLDCMQSSMRDMLGDGAADGTASYARAMAAPRSGYILRGAPPLLWLVYFQIWLGGALFFGAVVEGDQGDGWALLAAW